jgi:hypothetical protein
LGDEKGVGKRRISILKVLIHNHASKKTGKFFKKIFDHYDKTYKGIVFIYFQSSYSRGWGI